MTQEPDLAASFLHGRTGDKAAQRAFLNAASVLLRAYFRKRLTGAIEDAEDLTQDTLIALHTRAHTFDPAYPLTAWMYAIAKYKLCDFNRRSRRRAEAPMGDQEFAAIDASFEASDARADLGAMMARLPEKQRAMIRLVKLQQHRVCDVAAATGYSQSDVKISVHRGVKALSRDARRSAA